MSRVQWNFEAVDSWFFRGGRPFNQGDRLSRLDSVFPPAATTLQGAIRAAVARQRGWSPDQRPELWPKELGSADSLGDIKMTGPHLVRNNHVLYPMPRHAVRMEDGSISWLTPGPKVCTDLGMIELPRSADQETKSKHANDLWLECADLETLLAGNPPESASFYDASRLWHFESHVGIRINAASHTAQDSQLYETVHVRPYQGVQIAVTVEGLPSVWQLPIQTVPFGGESRYAHVFVTENGRFPKPALPEMTERGGFYHALVMLVTPGLFSNLKKTVVEGPLDGLQAVSAVTGPAVIRGGWDLQGQSPRATQAFIPAGSVWFYRLNREQWERIRPMHGQQVGEELALGYGQIFFGLWK